MTCGARPSFWTHAFQCVSCYLALVDAGAEGEAAAGCEEGERLLELARSGE